jgi:hypothetical protein
MIMVKVDYRNLARKSELLNRQQNNRKVLLEIHAVLRKLDPKRPCEI